MFYEAYHNGKGWGVRSITDKSGTKYKEKHIIYFGKGQDNWLKAKAKAAWLNGKDVKINDIHPPQQTLHTSKGER